ncbi:MAG: glycosyltransferase family 39 protein [Deltaproteobacteria bacterium]|nr:glycosyltransferase family 39 protein [Deltaproteobacteria bacterium]
MDLNRSGSAPWVNGYTLLLACLALYLPLFWQIPLIRDEAMYALIPKEMLASGSWLTPTLNGAPYLDKPHLIYWLNLLAYKIFGVSDRVARLPLLVTTLGEVWFTYLIGRRLLGRRAAWLGGLVLFTSIGFFVLHLQILTDHLITLSLVASLYFLLRWQEEPAFKWAGPFFLAMALGFLSKGFIGLVFPLLIGGLYAWHIRQTRLFSLFRSPGGLAVLALVLTPWFVGSELANPGFLKFQVVNEQIMRFLGIRQPPDINSFPLLGFWLFLGIWLMPHTPLLPSALWRYWRETDAAERRTGRLLIIWALVILLFFSLSSSRIEYYSLPALPPLALIIGWRLRLYLKNPADHALPYALAIIALLGLTTLFLLPYLEQVCAGNRREFYGMFCLISPVARPVTFMIPSLALAGFVAGIAWRHRVALGCYAVLALVLVFFTFRTYLALSPLMSDKAPAELLGKIAAPRDRVVMEQIEEFEYGACLEFYSGRHLLMVKRHGLPQFPYKVPPKQDYLITPEQLQALWQGPDRVFLLVDDATPLEPFLKGARTILIMPSKRLLANRP